MGLDVWLCYSRLPIIQAPKVCRDLGWLGLKSVQSFSEFFLRVCGDGDLGVVPGFRGRLLWLASNSCVSCGILVATKPKQISM